MLVVTLPATTVPTTKLTTTTHHAQNHTRKKQLSGGGDGKALPQLRPPVPQGQHSPMTRAIAVTMVPQANQTGCYQGGGSYFPIQPPTALGGADQTTATARRTNPTTVRVEARAEE